MTAEQMKKRELARLAIGNADFKTAKKYYDEFLLEIPEDENLEGVWFGTFFDLLDLEFSKKVIQMYADLSKLFMPILNYVAEIEDDIVKQNLASVIFQIFLPLGTSISNRTIVEEVQYGTFTITECAEFDATLIDKETAAELILEKFGESDPYYGWVVDIWKEKIADRYNFSPYRNCQDRGKKLWFDELAEKIKKYDPNYELPKFKQAGCISFDPKNKAMPGK